MAITLTQVWGAFLIFVLAPIIGGLPLTGWVTRLVSGQQLAKLGTGNVSVSAAFYHGGRVAGILSVLLEAAKGISVVLLARHFFPDDPVWEIIGLIALVMGRYWVAKGAGTTNVVWGFIIHDWVTALLTMLVSGLGFTIFRQRRQGRLLVLVLLPIFTALRHTQDGPLILAVACLSALIAWIYSKIPDDLNLSVDEGRLESRSMFRFFRGDRSLVSLDRPSTPTSMAVKPLFWASSGPGVTRCPGATCCRRETTRRRCWRLPNPPPSSPWWCAPRPRTKTPAPCRRRASMNPC
jgi:glycerol-3-phosphate acyltransferase PlsY